VPAGVVVAAGYVVIAFVLTIATWRAPSTTYVGEGPDPVRHVGNRLVRSPQRTVSMLVSTAMNTPPG